MDTINGRIVALSCEFNRKQVCIPIRIIKFRLSLLFDCRGGNGFTYLKLFSTKQMLLARQQKLLSLVDALWKGTQWGVFLYLLQLQYWRWRDSNSHMTQRQPFTPIYVTHFQEDDVDIQMHAYNIAGSNKKNCLFYCSLECWKDYIKMLLLFVWRNGFWRGIDKILQTPFETSGPEEHPICRTAAIDQSRPL